MSKLSILIIDDENELESIYRAHLNKIDAEVTFSNHPQKAWKNLDKFTYDLIVTDLKMPIISGDEFIHIVRSSRTNLNTPIILCSGYIDKKTSTELTRESKVYFLSKPFTQKSLLDLIEKIFNVGKNGTIDTKSSEADHPWIKIFTSQLDALFITASISTEDDFPIWNHDCMNLDFTIKTNNNFFSCSLLMHEAVFLKIAGKIQGTLYKNIESEVLLIWKNFLKGTEINTTRIIFSMNRSKKFINSSNDNFIQKIINTDCGDILIYIK